MRTKTVDARFFFGRWRIGGHRLGLLQQQRLHVGQHEAQVQSAGAVDVANVTLAVDQEHTQRVIQRAGRVVGIPFPVHGLAVSGKDRLQLFLRRGGDEAPVGGRLSAMRQRGGSL